MIVVLLLVIAMILLMLPLSFIFPATVLRLLNFLYFLLNFGAFALLIAIMTGYIVFLHIVLNVVKEDLKIRSFHVPRYWVDHYMDTIGVIYLISVGVFYGAFQLCTRNKLKRASLKTSTV